MENTDDKTRIISSKDRQQNTAITLSYMHVGEQIKREFSKSFVLGRSLDCDIVINDEAVSRQHAEVIMTAEGWKIRDLKSSNGSYVDGKRVDEKLLAEQTEFYLGSEQTVFSVSLTTRVEPVKASPEIPAVKTVIRQSEPVERESPVIQPRAVDTEAEVLDRYFKDRPEQEMGEHTLMMRKVIKREKEALAQKVSKKVSSRYKVIVASIVVLLIFSAGFIAYQQIHLSKAKLIAIDMFYDIKHIEIQLAQTEEDVKKTGTETQLSNLALKRQKLKEMKARYEDYLTELDFAKKFKPSLSEEDQAIVSMAKIFGECDIDLPAEFISEVKKYIAKWQSSNRLANAVSRIEKLGHAQMVVNAMNAVDLPPQFLYISLQESNFRFDAIGPETRFGIAKGAWQFIPATGEEYGLKIGPLAAYREHDPDDERFDFEKASFAAAKYLKKIYSTEAQASGLLVMASYNWGHNRVKRLIKKMPNNPRERNFWKLTQQYKMPKETYDYVFYIFSAAVIGDNPGLFGFDFKDPVIVGLQGDGPAAL